jgi:hypothetical protein
MAITTIQELLNEMIDAGSITLALTQSQANSLRTKLYSELKIMRKQDLGIFAEDKTFMDRVTNSSIQLHYDTTNEYATYEFASKPIKEYKLIPRQHHGNI